MRQYDSPVGSSGSDTGAGAPADDRDPEQIRVEIAQTRTEMSGTIDAIQQRLTPEVLSAQAKDIARDATEQAKTAAQEVIQDTLREAKEAAKEVTDHAVYEVKSAAHDVTVGAKDAAWDATIGRAEDAVVNAGETAKGVSAIVIDTIKQHPIPAALAGLSLYWMYTHRAGGQPSSAPRSGMPRMAGSYSGSYQAPGVSHAYPIRTGYASQAERDAMSSSARMTGTRPAPSAGAPHYDNDDDGGIISSASEMASDAMSTASQVASDAVSSAGQMASDAASTAGHLASNAGETATDLGSTIVDLVRQNPVPAALVGIGLGWLYMNRSSGPDYRAHSGSHYLYGPQAASQAYRPGNQSSTSGVGGMVSRATDQVGDLANSAQEQIGGMADSVQEQVGEMADTVMEQTRRAPDQIERMIQDRPLVAAAIAGSLGAAVGLWLPSTTVETQFMGKASGQVMDRAQEVASDTFEKVQEVASETMEKVQDAAKDVRTTVKEEAKSKGLTV